MKLGIISDTHGLVRGEALAALEGCGLIIHAGDIGDPAVVARLEAIAPVAAIRGNVDRGAWAEAYPAERVVAIGRWRILVLHDLAALGPAPEQTGMDMIVSGHSHRPRIVQMGDVLMVNPGSAGRRRFKLPVTLVTLAVTEAELGAPVLHDLAPPAPSD